MKQLLIILSLCLLLPSHSTYADDINLTADYWCPYNCKPNSNYEGYLIDMARAVFEPKGHTVSYKTIPWTRSLIMTERSDNFASVGAYKNARNNLIYPKVTSGFSVNSFVMMKKTDWEYTGIDSLKNIRIGAINSYLFGEPVDSYFKTHKDKVTWIFGDNPLKRGFRMLEVGKIDVLIDDQNVLTEVAKKIGILDQVGFAGDVLPGNGVHIGFSQAGEKGRVYARQYSEGILEMRKDGRLKTILDKYGLTDWVDKEIQQ